MSELALEEVQIFSDGACRGNPGPGGYGAIVRCGQITREFSASDSLTTNNRMELMAAIVALESLSTPAKVQIATDSQYVVKGMTEWLPDWTRKGWKTASGKAVMNRDLWERLIAASQPHIVTWVWVKGHNGHTENERCDRLANEAIDAR